jgi:hypothetical protein
VKCKRCAATVADDRDETLALARWGWTMAPDPGLGEDSSGIVPGWFYACPECSDDDSKDAFAFVRELVQMG